MATSALGPRLVELSKAIRTLAANPAQLADKLHCDRFLEWLRLNCDDGVAAAEALAPVLVLLIALPDGTTTTATKHVVCGCETPAVTTGRTLAYGIITVVLASPAAATVLAKELESEMRTAVQIALHHPAASTRDPALRMLAAFAQYHAGLTTIRGAAPDLTVQLLTLFSDASVHVAASARRLLVALLLGGVGDAPEIVPGLANICTGKNLEAHGCLISLLEDLAREVSVEREEMKLFASITETHGIFYQVLSLVLSADRVVQSRASNCVGQAIRSGILRVASAPAANEACAAALRVLAQLWGGGSSDGDCTAAVRFSAALIAGDTADHLLPLDGQWSHVMESLCRAPLLKLSSGDDAVPPCGYPVNPSAAELQAMAASTCLRFSDNDELVLVSLGLASSNANRGDAELALSVMSNSSHPRVLRGAVSLLDAAFRATRGKVIARDTWQRAARALAAVMESPPSARERSVSLRNQAAKYFIII